MVVIDRFQGDYFFLSNFYPVLIEYDGWVYTSVEHAYQASKTLLIHQRRQISALDASKANIAKRLGKTVTLRPGWDDMKEHVMHELVLQKFSFSELQLLLKATNDTPLIEGNSWHDTYWGVCTCHTRNHNAEGLNKLGKILELVRSKMLQ